jgi:hypothetical protein
VEEAWLARWGRLTWQAMGWSLVGESGSPRIEGRGVVYTVEASRWQGSACRVVYVGERAEAPAQAHTGLSVAKLVQCCF